MEVLGFASSCVLWRCWPYQQQRSQAAALQTEDTHRDKLAELSAYENLIGNTPLVKLRKASELTGCDILVKMESMNPGRVQPILCLIMFYLTCHPPPCNTGGTGKDRAAKMMLLDAMATGKLPARGGIVVEGTSGRCAWHRAGWCRVLSY